MIGRCMKCRVVYSLRQLILLPREITCHCGTRLARTNTHCLDRIQPLKTHQVNEVVRTKRIPKIKREKDAG